MTMISYAQNHEDVVLRRLFSPDHQGLYIDVGASHPLEDTVTRYFYERGWQGISIEPGAIFHKLVEYRPRDINLNLGLSNAVGEKTFYDFVDFPGSSTYSAGEAEVHCIQHGRRCVERPVMVTTLKAVCEQHVHRPIDFISIDVEGHEREVLEGGDWDRFRPLVVLIEATRPNTSIPTHGQWEDLLWKADYRFALFDGLNRYYIRGEDSHLLPRLVAPANHLDDFIPHRYVKQIADLEHRMALIDGVGPRTLALAKRLHDAAVPVQRWSVRVRRVVGRRISRGSSCNGSSHASQSESRAHNAIKLSAARPARPRRILIDCTLTYRYDAGTGVQRVVRNLVNSADAHSRATGVTCQPVIYDNTFGFCPVDALPLARTEPPQPAEPESPLKRGARGSLNAVGLLTPAVEFKRMMRRGLTRLQGRRPPNAQLQMAGAGDMILLADPTWDMPDLWKGVQAARRRGAKVATVVYDLIPLQFPESFPQTFVENFRKWWDNVRSNVDFVVCISQSVWADVQAYVKNNSPSAATNPTLRGGAFRLGAELEGAEGQGQVRPELRQLFANELTDNPYLMVGTYLVPRKNYPLALEAFERLWAAGSNARLVTVGRGLIPEPTPWEQIAGSHPEFGRRLFTFRDMEDADLDFCYRNAAALITASDAEGFNLPIIESLSRGRPVLASDIPIHREVAGSHGAYFRPRKSESLAEMISRHQAGELRHSLAPLDHFRWPTWLESSRELIDRAISLYCDASQPELKLAS
jgi:FkbM family methyltransferase